MFPAGWSCPFCEAEVRCLETRTYQQTDGVVQLVRRRRYKCLGEEGHYYWTKESFEKTWRTPLPRKPRQPKKPKLRVKKTKFALHNAWATPLGEGKQDDEKRT